MKAVNQKIVLLEQQVGELQATVNTLQDNIVQLGALVKYLTTTQMELSADMGKIYRSLQTVLKAIGNPHPMMTFPVLGADDDDDDLLN